MALANDDLAFVADDIGDITRNLNFATLKIEYYASQRGRNNLRADKLVTGNELLHNIVSIGNFPPRGYMNDLSHYKQSLPRTTTRSTLFAGS